MILAARSGDDNASFKPGAKAMANDVETVRSGGESVWKLCLWAAVALLLTFLILAAGITVISRFETLPTAAAPGRPSVSC